MKVPTNKVMAHRLKNSSERIYKQHRQTCVLCGEYYTYRDIVNSFEKKGS